MFNNNQNVGKIGENLACEYLIKNRYKILFRNYRVKFDEIDIIARSFDGVLVFVEVKTLKVSGASCLMPEDNFTKDKFQKINRACRIFAGSHKELINDERGWRIDLVAVTLGEKGECGITHYENVTKE